MVIYKKKDYYQFIDFEIEAGTVLVLLKNLSQFTI
ncbi:Uncharacterised protein [Chryseobacterium taihuense]|uniref:Uncharacterized protein n=1 Tax=Chryseobacterium taihuense TaxID=1141221 RepID=A0A4V6ID64_9FLAO|nr:Uncharacterised protein [Chryseobacterium taihuense]